MALRIETKSRWTTELPLVRCNVCKGALRDEETALVCESCATVFPIRDEILIAKEEPSSDNKIAQDFYNGALWPKFRVWESIFWFFHGGERKSRNEILKHLPTDSRMTLLDIAIGDGVYTSWLPEAWSIVGLDVSTSQLNACQKRNGGRDLRLILGEAESLPFDDDSFDAVLSIGGFNHFHDPELALREMARVAKPGSKVVVADELPDITNRMLGHKLGIPGIDRWFVSKVMNLGDPFTDLVERHRDIDIAKIGESVLKQSRYELIWRRSGYLMVGLAP